MQTASEMQVRLPNPHLKQREFILSEARRKVVRAGRRSGKTVGVAILAVQEFLRGKRVLYGTPTSDQIQRFWFEVTKALAEPIQAGLFEKNETLHAITLPGTTQRIRAKTCWNADGLRGDFCSLLILDEYQLMNEDAWELVGVPMLLDNNGDAVFIYTPPSIQTASVTKARDPRHASKLFKKAQADTSGRWATFHFSSHENPFISKEALEEISSDMTSFGYAQEILAEDKEDNPRALWKTEQIEALRVIQAPDLFRIVTAIDPSATKTGNEAGIITGGIGWCKCKGDAEKHGFILDDSSLQGSPEAWASAAVTSYHKHNADALIAEQNNGGEMVSVTISTIKGAPPVKLIHASRGKQVRAEPVSALYEKGMVHHVGKFGVMESELTGWDPSMPDSPNRLDALVWCVTELMLNKSEWKVHTARF